jgi:hypothetical protein
MSINYVDVESCSDKMSDDNNKIHSRTHHTRFFEKLYGNLDKESSEDVKTQSVEYPSDNQVESESNASSSSDINVTRCLR